MDSAAKNSATLGLVQVTVQVKGKKQFADVLLLNTREIIRFGNSVLNEPELAELFTRNRPGWADDLDLDSVFTIVAAGEELNRENFTRYAAAKARRGESLAPLFDAMRAATKAAASTSPTGSPESAPAPA